MSDATFDTRDGKVTLRFVREFPYPLETVWNALTEPAQMERWSPGVVDWIPAAGEQLAAYGMTGEVLEAEPPRHLAWNFHGDNYIYDLTPDGSGCRLVYVYTFGGHTPAAQSAAGWDAYLERLDVHLAGGYLSEEDAHAGMEQRIEHYTALFTDLMSP